MTDSLPCFEIAPERFVGEQFPCFIIAEIGQNHQGDIQLAKKLIKTAKECGVDCVKFQKSDLNSRFTKDVLNRPYNSPNSWGETYGLHRQHLELSDEDFVQLQQYSIEKEIIFTASGMDKKSIDFLHKLNVPFFKIGSADSSNLPLLHHVSKYQKPVVVSTGMTCFENVRKMYHEVIQVNKSLGILQCTSSYPTSIKEINLNVIKTYKEKFPEAVIGYSGHEIGLSISFAAVAVGAKILERHITLDKSLKGSDHIASLDPDELKQLVTEVRRIETALGSRQKIFEFGEDACYEKLGKTVVASKFIPCDTPIDEDMIDVKVSITKGWDPFKFYDLIGRRLKRDYNTDESILPCDLIPRGICIKDVKGEF